MRIAAIPRAVIGIGAALSILGSASSALYAGDKPGSRFGLDEFEAEMAQGAPRDGIPAIDNPDLVDASEADDFLEDDDIVFGVVRNGEARAYPRRILVWHEIVNDTVGGDKLAVTYCPLTATAIGFRRGDTTFGVSGRLINSNLVMYDRRTESYWPQILGTAINGPRKGERLTNVPVTWTRWENWRAAHPDTSVLSRRTDYARNYNRDPYGSYGPPDGYYARGSRLMFPVMNEDQRLDNKAIIVAALTPDGPLAVSKDRLREAGHLRLRRDNNQYIILYDQALDAGRVFRLRSRASLNDHPIELTSRGPVQDGKSLAAERIVAWDAFWFAWVAFYPRTLVRN